ncbi:MAG: hypothetical protein ACRC2V_09915 [Xenococcaceae cyanobacterium]
MTKTLHKFKNPSVFFSGGFWFNLGVVRERSRMKFNINDYVKVRLTVKGKKYLRERHEQLFISLPNSKKPKFKLPTEDKDGWSKYQLWVLMGEFGECFQYPGCDPPFETEIEIVIESDRNG